MAAQPNYEASPTDTSTSIVITTPHPGDVYDYSYEHPDNAQLLEGDERARKLSKKEMQEIHERIPELAAHLVEHRYVERTARLEQIQERIDLLDYTLSTGTELDISEDDIKARLNKLQEAAKKLELVLDHLQLRDAATLLHRYEARLLEHEQAVRNESLYKDLTKQQTKEVKFFWEKIRDRWAALGYKEVYTKGDKRIVNKVRCEAVWVTPDEIWYKVAVSELTLLKSNRHYLPEGVRVWDLVKPDTLHELSAACERPVSSPHTEENRDFQNGAYVTIHRLGMNDGLFNFISYDQFMARYNQANRSRFPMPIGVERGRIARYVNLDSTPHMMVTGQTGSGKSNWLRAVMSTVISMHSPAEIRLLVVDLKNGADFNFLESTPHLEGKIIRSVEDVAIATHMLVTIMRSRMKVFTESGHVNILEFNKHVNRYARMPRIIMLLDEVSAINALSFDDKVTSKAIWNHLTLLAQQARAAGIHLILGTQQSFSDAINKNILSNITFLMSGKQRTLGGSLATIGNKKSKSLAAIPGRMYCVDGTREYEVQTPFISNEAINKAVDIAKNYPPPLPLSEAMPEGDDTPGVFTMEQFIEWCLRDNEGKISYMKAYEAYDGSLPRKYFRKLADDLKDMETIQHDGKTYGVKRLGRAYQMVEIEPDTPKHQEKEVS